MATSNTELRQKLIETVAAINAAIAELAEEPSSSDPQSRQICWGAKVSKDFRDSVLWIEKELGLKADFLMTCMAFETGLTFSPSIKNPGSSATGLIQFMEATAKALGTTTLALKQMSAVRQLSYVYKYFKGYEGNFAAWSLEDVYMSILLPAMIGKPLDEKMRWSNQAYMANKGLDADKNGVITKREATEKIRSLYQLGMKKENMA